MSRLLLATALALLPTCALAQSADDLVPEFRKACRVADAPALVRTVAGAGDYGQADAKKVRSALLKVYGIDPGLLVDETADALATRALAAGRDNKTDDGKLAVIADLVEEWSVGRATPILPLSAGGLTIRTSAGASPDPKVALAKIFAGDGSDLVIICRDPQAPPPVAPPSRAPGTETAGGKPSFVLVKTIADLAQSDITKKSFAEFSYADDRDTRVQTYGVNLAAGLQWGERGAGNEETFYQHWTPSLYVAYERKGENDPANDSYVNNLNFGGQIAGDLQMKLNQTLITYYTLSVQYETDDDFLARAYSAALQVSPPLPYDVPGYRGFIDLPSAPGVDLEAAWSVDAVADWSQVDDPGEKKALVDKAEYVRLGYDAGFKVRVGPSAYDRDWRAIWSVLYQLRDGRTEDGGDAQLFTSSLMFALSKETHYSFGLSYERGENLQSFARSELWKLVFGLRY